MRIPVLASLGLSALAAAALAGDEPAPARGGRLVHLGLNAQGAEEWLRVKDGAVVVRVPRGPYLRRPYEPQATTATGSLVPVESFLIDKHEVTNARFARFLGEQTGDLAALWREDVAGVARSGSGFAASPGMDEFPVTSATGLGALAYAKWAGARIPSSAEWEKAAGGPDGRIFPWGNEPPDAARANFGRPSARGLERVGSHAAGASFYGCMDMAGNAYDRVLVQRGPHAAPEMLKGGSWASPHPLNLRVLDLCMQPRAVAEGTVGFRCAMDDDEPERPARAAAAPPVLRLAKDFDAAVAEAKRRRVPVFLSLLFDTCGQCDRTRAQLFRDPRFVAWCNENLVVIVGHEPGDALDDPHPANADGTCPLYPGLTCAEHLANYARGLQVVGTFVVSPGNFVLHPDRMSNGAGESAVLVREGALPKWGNAVDAYLAAFEKARAAMAAETPAASLTQRLTAVTWVNRGSRSIVGEGTDVEMDIRPGEGAGLVAEIRTTRHFSVNTRREPETTTHNASASIDGAVLELDGVRRTVAFEADDLLLGVAVETAPRRWAVADGGEEWEFEFAADPRTAASGEAKIRGTKQGLPEGGVAATYEVREKGESREVVITAVPVHGVAWNLPGLELRRGKSVGWMTSRSSTRGERFTPKR